MMDGLLDFFHPSDITVSTSEDGVRRLADSAVVHTKEQMGFIEEAKIFIFGS